MNADLLTRKLLTALFLLLQIGGWACAGEEASPGDPRPLSFVGDVLPILSKAGCNSSGCHSAPDGQNGFRLSVFSYDPRSDFEEIVMQGHGRRVTPSAPELSLFLMKPTQEFPHEGGKRLEKGSASYETLKRWIAQGMVYQLPDEPSLVGIELARTAALRRARRDRAAAGGREVLGREPPRGHHAGRLQELGGCFCRGGRGRPLLCQDKSGRGVIVVRYMGEVAIAKVSVAPERQLPAETYAALPHANLIDEHAIARWASSGSFRRSSAATASSSGAPRST